MRTLYKYTTPAPPRKLRSSQDTDVPQPADSTQQPANVDVSAHATPDPPPEPMTMSGAEKIKEGIYTVMVNINYYFFTGWCILDDIYCGYELRYWWLEVPLKFVYVVLLLVGIALSPRDPFPVYLLAMDFAWAVLLGVLYCLYFVHPGIFHSPGDSEISYRVYIESISWWTFLLVVCSLGSTYVGAFLYTVVPSIRGTLLGVSYIAIGYISRFFWFTSSLRRMLARYQYRNPEYGPFVMQLINTAVSLICHWLAVSTLLHVLVYNIYPSKPKEFNFFDTMYYICLCFINGPTDELIFDSIVARLVVISLILALFLTLPGEFSKLSQAYKTLRDKRDKLELLVHHYMVGRLRFDCTITGHLTLNSVMGFLTMRQYSADNPEVRHLLLLDNKPLEPELEVFLKRQPRATTAHFYQYEELSDHIMEQLSRLLSRVYILADYNASLKDTVENIQRHDERNLQLCRRFLHWTQHQRSYWPRIYLQVVLHESLVLARKVCPETQMMCSDDVFTSLFVHNTAAFGFSTFVMLCGAQLSPHFMEQIYETAMSIASKNQDYWESPPIGQAISLFSLNRGQLFPWEGDDLNFEVNEDDLRYMAQSSGIICLGAKFRLGAACTTNTESTWPPVAGVHNTIRVLSPAIYFPHFVLNPVLRELPKNRIPILLSPRLESCDSYLNSLPMTKNNSTVPGTTERGSDNVDTRITSNLETTPNLHTAVKISEPHLVESFQFIYRYAGMGYADDEMDAIGTLPCKGHLVICDYLNQISRQVLPFIRQARVAHNNPELPVVLITDFTLNGDLIKRLEALGQLYIVRGAPHHLNNLQRANVVQAKAVVAFHWVDDTQPEIPSTLDALCQQLRALNPRVPLIQFTSSAILRQWNEYLEKFRCDPERRFSEYWGPLASGEGVYMDLRHLILDDRPYVALNSFLFPNAIPESSYWATLDLNEPPFIWSTSVCSDVISSQPTSVSCEKLTQHLRLYNIVFVGMRRMLEHSPKKWDPSVAFVPPEQLLLFPQDQVILLVPRSLSLAKIEIEL
ncbi:hypothetical protein IWQ62_004288 [Dispira parvispora]|uniref:RCK N-terminal domain-containing protein n=1 Tax=Dispira parvispora TaxID=1520584 RepID=A0A9W8ASR6_9FUNG|nr:hypothetical protein IWQ62_004288 [Dispira parvispora]